MLPDTSRQFLPSEYSVTHPEQGDAGRGLGIAEH